MPVLIVRLRGEDRGDVLEAAGDNSGRLGHALSQLDRGSYPYLALVDPFGLTIFNRLQVEVVISELRRVREEPAFSSLKEVLDQILRLALKCQEEVHLYVEFEGD
jgi:hypothetical protein